MKPSTLLARALWIALPTLAVAEGAWAQQVTIGAPFQGGGHSFFERNGVGPWSVRGPGWFLNVGGFGGAPPQFGGFQPGAGIGGGVGFAGGPNGGLVFAFDQGARSSLISQAASVTVMNGRGGIISDAAQSPFVISTGHLPWKQQWEGRIPMQRPRWQVDDPPGTESQGTSRSPPGQSAEAVVSAGRTPDDPGRLSVAEIQRQRQTSATVEEQEATAWFEKARQAEAEGKPGLARIHYQMAARRAGGELKQQILQRLAALEK
jgi:hypothetical protein